MAETEYKYFAFISYNHVDFRWGKRLFHKLEYYKMSSNLCKLHGWSKRNPISPVFFAPYEIQPNELSDELKDRLNNSKYLIVLCSPNSAHSKWVGLEIEYFCKLGRKDRIYFFIIDGEPNAKDSKKECYNDAVFELGLSSRLGVNINEKIYKIPWLNKERAYVQLVTKLLEIEFDAVWQRHRRQLIFQVFIYFAIIVAFLFSIMLVWRINQPQSVLITLIDKTIEKTTLPPFKDGRIEIQIGDSFQKFVLKDINQKLIIPNVPFRLMGEKQKIRLMADGYSSLDTIIALQNHIEIPVNRDWNYYGAIRGIIWNKNDDNILVNSKLEIGNVKVISDSNGYIDVVIPLDKQDVGYDISQDGNIIGRVFMPFRNNKIIVDK